MAVDTASQQSFLLLFGVSDLQIMVNQVKR